MKLNPDCIRDILILTEEKICTIRQLVTFNRETIPEFFPQYDIETVLYHIRQCDMNGFFFNPSVTMEYNWHIMDLTPKAHEFLANIREDNIWNHVKVISSKVGSKSLNVLTQIASSTVSAIIKSQLSL